MSNDLDDLLQKNEIEPEDLEEDVTDTALEERHELDEEDAQFEAEEKELEEAEATLDEILRQRLEGEEAEREDEEEPEAGVAVPGEEEEEVQPRTSEEFVCKSCFLVKSRSQLADAARALCTDCVINQVRA